MNTLDPPSSKKENASTEELGPGPPPDQHWAGYEGEAVSYPVVDRGRYVLLAALLVFALILTAIAVMIHGNKLAPSPNAGNAGPNALAPVAVVDRAAG